MDETATFTYAIVSGLDALVEMRMKLRQWLAAVGVGSQEAEDVVLAAWEVCANAIEHPVGPKEPGATLVACATKLGVRIAVHDTGSWRVTAVRRTDRGLGLRLARKMMDRVSIRRGPPGTEVVMWRFTGGHA